jgi:hypothetical protein
MQISLEEFVCALDSCLLEISKMIPCHENCSNGEHHKKCEFAKYLRRYKLIDPYD